MIDEVNKKIKGLSDDDIFLISVTRVSNKKTGELSTHLYSNKFPYQAFESTRDMINKLIEEHKNK